MLSGQVIVDYRPYQAQSEIEKNMSQLDRVRFVLRGHMLHFAASVLVIILSTGLQSLVAVLIYPLTQVATGGEVTAKHLETVNNYIFGKNDFSIVLLEICLIFGLATVVKYVHVLIARLLGLRVKQSLTGKIFQTYITNEFGFHVGQKQGVLINNLVNETERVDNAIVFILQYVNQAVMAISLTIVMISFSWKIFVSIMLFGVLIYLSIKKVAFEYSSRTGKKRVEIYQQVNSLAAEAFNGIKQIKIFDFEEPVLRKMSEYLSAYTKLMIKFIALRRLPGPLIQFMVAVIVIIAVLFNMKLNFLDPIEVLPLFVTLSYVAMRLFLNLTELLTSHMNLVSYGPSIDVVSTILSDRAANDRAMGKTEEEPGITIESICDSLELKNGCFSYFDDKNVLDNINLIIPTGSKVGIVGYSGSGKSTLINLLLGLYPLTSGAILVDGKDINSLSRKSYRKRVGVVSQDVFVFYGTVVENIRIGLPTADDETVVRAAKMANAHDFIEKLPQKYDTIIGEKGSNLSGGECQRIAIARALVRDPDLLIFDEATSSLDKESENLIIEAIKNIGDKKTEIIVSHNLNSIISCDVIYVFDKGRIVEQGTHAALLEEKGVYWDLYSNYIRLSLGV